MNLVATSYVLMLSFTAFAFLIARVNRGKLTLPVLSTLSVYLPFLLVIQKGFLYAFVLLITWCACQSFLTIIVVLRNSNVWAERIWKGKSYTDSMFRWVRTGELPEGNRVIQVHLKQLVFFCLLAVLTLNFGALMLGCLLLNYMNFYVAQLANQTTRKSMAVVIGWNPWSVVRVISFLYLAVACSSFSLWFVLPLPFHPSIWILIPGVIGVVSDVVLKLKMSESWSERIRRELDIPR